MSPSVAEHNSPTWNAGSLLLEVDQLLLWFWALQAVVQSPTMIIKSVLSNDFTTSLFYSVVFPWYPSSVACHGFSCSIIVSVWTSSHPAAFLYQGVLRGTWEVRIISQITIYPNSKVIFRSILWPKEWEWEKIRARKVVSDEQVRHLPSTVTLPSLQFPWTGALYLVLHTLPSSKIFANGVLTTTSGFWLLSQGC